MMSITRIDPDLPLCWEDAETIRIGFDRPVSRIRRPSAAEQRLLGALRTGVPTASLDDEARKIGLAPPVYRRLMGSLRPALLEEPRGRSERWPDDVHRATTVPRSAAPPRLRVLISDGGRNAPGLREALGMFTSCDIDVDARVEECDLVVHVERYLEPLERAQRWRALGMPHLLVRFSDRAVQIGPIVEAAGSPCHSCVSLELVARDAALPLLAMQLHERIPLSESRAAGEFTAVYAALLLREWHDGASAPRNTRWVIPVVHGRPTGEARSEAVPPHPGCSCGDALDAEFSTVKSAVLTP